MYTNITAYDAICDPDLLGNYLVPPESVDDPDLLLEDFSNGLCNMTTKQALDLTVLIVDEINVEEFLSGVSQGTPHFRISRNRSFS